MSGGCERDFPAGEVCADRGGRPVRMPISSLVLHASPSLFQARLGRPRCAQSSQSQLGTLPGGSCPSVWTMPVAFPRRPAQHQWPRQSASGTWGLPCSGGTHTGF